MQQALGLHPAYQTPLARSFCHPAGGAAQLCVAAGGIACRTLVKGKQLPPLLPVLDWRMRGRHTSLSACICS